MKKIKQTDKRIITGVALLLFSLIIYLITTPSPEDRIKNKITEIDEAKLLEEQQDINNLNAAIIMDNRKFCENIISPTIKEDCKSRVFRSEEIESSPEISDEEREDINKLNNAIIMDNVKFCNEIINQEMKNNCTQRFQ